MIQAKDGLVSLRRIGPQDQMQLYQWRNDVAVWKWCRQNDLLDWNTHQQWLHSLGGRPDVTMYVISDEVGPVGVCGLTDIDHVNQRAEFSCYVDPKQRGKGYAKSAMQTLFSHGFDNLNLNVIWGETFDGNPATGLFEAIGMVHEGLRRQFYYRAGAWIGAHLYSITKAEYLEKPWKSHYIW